MSNYVILEDSYKMAKLLKLDIKTSKNINKKIDVYKDGLFIFSIGNIKYLDYSHYIKNHSLDYANNRRKLYYKRNKLSHDINSRKYISAKILW